MTAHAPGAAEPVAWGGESRMNALEALMWRAEADPQLRSTIFAIELLDGAPEWDRLRAAHDWGTRLIPRFRERVLEPPLGLGIPTWTVDERFDLDYHVRRQRLAGDGSERELLDVAGQLAMTPFDRARPPWEAILFEGLSGGRAAYMLKFHHSATDGMGGIQLLGQVHSRRREHDPGKPQRPAPAPASGSHRALQALGGQLARDAVRAAGAAARAPVALSRGLLRPRRTAAELTGYAASLARVLADAGTAGSPLLAPRSLSRRLSALDVGFEDLRAAGRAAGGSLNDAYLAALLGALRRYHEAHGIDVGLLPMAVPISVRREGDPAGGNRFAATSFAAPAAIAAPDERIRQISRIVRAARSEPALEGISVLATALSRVPGSLAATVAGGMARANDLQASNVPGIREEVFLAGSRIERFYGFGPLPGCALMIVLVSHGDRCCVSVNADRAAIADGALFDRCLVEGFGEVLELAEGAEPPVLRS